MAGGRPRKSDLNDVLGTVMKTFWIRGFEVTSMNHLSDATGMAKPGLYKAFGDKQALYSKALKLYLTKFAEPMIDDLLNSPDSLVPVLRRNFERLTSTVLNKTGPKGCFIACSLNEHPNMPADLAELSSSYNERRTAAYAKRIRMAIKQGELTADADEEALSIYLTGQVLAITVMARSGADKRSLDRFIDMAMQALPLVEA